MKLDFSLTISSFILGLFLLCSCSTKKEIMLVCDDPGPVRHHAIITAPIVTKNFVNKAGVTTGQVEYYIQQSMQDYFIKFCESNVSIKELNEKLENIEGDIKALQLEVEMREGDWDICDGNHEIQSRVGEYMVILKILD
jgi:hypothetical protein